MQVADIRSAPSIVLLPDSVGKRSTPGDRSADKRGDTGLRPDDRAPQGSQPVVYGELIPRAATLARNAPPSAQPPASGEPIGNPTRAAIAHLGHGQAIDVYKTLQDHATAQVLSPVYRIDLYA